MSANHKYKPLPRGDHEITVKLCYECDTWHASDDSLLYNENAKKEWEARATAAEARLQVAVAGLEAMKMRSCSRCARGIPFNDDGTHVCNELTSRGTPCAGDECTVDVYVTDTLAALDAAWDGTAPNAPA